MYQENVVLCGASAYEQKFYFNPDFQALPEQIRQELQIMCVLFTEDVGGILTLEADAFFDEIGSALKIKQIQREKREFLESLELYYRVFFLGEEADSEEVE